MKRENNKDTIHFNGERSNTELLFRIIHSATQLCIYGAVTDRCERLGRREAEREENSGQTKQNLNSRILKSVDAQEVNSLVKESGKPQASGNRLREGLRDFESATPDIQFKEVCEKSGFYRRVKKDKYYKTISRRGRWIWRNHPNVSRIHTLERTINRRVLT